MTYSKLKNFYHDSFKKLLQENEIKKYPKFWGRGTSELYFNSGNQNSYTQMDNMNTIVSQKTEHQHISDAD